MAVSTFRHRAADVSTTPIFLPSCTSAIHPPALSPRPFGRFAEWTPAVLEGNPSFPGSARAIACYNLAKGVRLCDLDDPEQLKTLGLRPSDVVNRDYVRTRAWARRIYEQGDWAGVRWWSYYDARWASVGLWETEGLAIEEVRALRLEDAAVLEASGTIARRIVSSKGSA